MDLPLEERIGFLSFELNKKDHTIKWRGSHLEGHETTANHILEVHNVIVGKAAVRGEENLVQVTVSQPTGEITETPLAYVSKGDCNQVALNIRFTSGATFTLAEGSGPVHINATHSIAPCVEDEFEEEECEEDDENDINSYPPGGDETAEIPLDARELLKRKKFMKNGTGKKMKLETSDSEDDELNEEEAADV